MIDEQISNGFCVCYARCQTGSNHPTYGVTADETRLVHLVFGSGGGDLEEDIIPHSNYIRYRGGNESIFQFQRPSGTQHSKVENLPGDIFAHVH